MSEQDVLVMNEKESFIRTWEQELRTTINVLKAYPAGKDDLRPAAPLRTAAELAGVLVGETIGFMDGAVKGRIDWEHFPRPPATIKEIASIIEREHARALRDIRAMTEDEWNAEMDVPTGPRQMGKVRRADLLWMTLHDMIHHRGQFTIYERIAGGKVPSIYGPTAEEPWS